MSGPHPHAGEHPAEVQRIRSYGISEGQELSDDLRPIREFEISLWKSSILELRILRGYGGKEPKANSGVYPHATVRGQGG